MRTNWRLEALQWILILGMFGSSAALWSKAPERIPVHWNLAGEPDRYGGKFEGLLVAPLAALGLYVLLLAAPLIDPLRRSYEAFARGYGVIRVALLAFLAAMHCVILLAAFRRPVDVSAVVLVGAGILFCVLASVMGKVRPNWFVGVRTPWTLSSVDSWNRTHRLAVPLFLATGAAMFLLAAVRNAWTLAILVVCIAATAIGLPVYSYVVWRRDLDRSPRPGRE